MRAFTILFVSLCCIPSFGQDSSLPTINTMHRALSDPVNLYLTLAKEVAQQLTDEELRTPIYGNRPILHHMLNLYFLSKNHQHKNDLVDLMIYFIQRGVDVDAPFQNDPEILFKSLMIREIAVAVEVARRASFKSPATFQQLFAIPCDPIPFSKMLLHATTIIQARNITDLNIVRAMIASAVNSNSKPIVRIKDLLNISSVFNTIVDDIPSSDMILLSNVLSSLNDVSHAVFEASLTHMSPADVTALLQHTDASGRNALHHAAVASSVPQVLALVELYTQHTSFLPAVASMLSAHDIRGHSPLTYASIRYGDAPISTVMRRLAELAGVEVENVKASNPSATCVTDDEGVCISAELPAYVSGGWSTQSLSKSVPTTNRCDILEVLTTPEDLTTDDFFQHYLAQGRPVIFRNFFANSTFQSVFKKETFLEKYGAEVIPVSKIPYASTFGQGGEIQHLKDVATVESEDEEVMPNTPPLYAFNTANKAWYAKLSEDAPLPVF